MVNPKYHVFVCAGNKLSNDTKGLCYTRGAPGLARKLMDVVDEHELSGEVMINTTSCFGVCDKGPIMLVYPEGIWYGHVSEEDIETIVDRHLENGEPVKSLQI